jgi:phosphoserine phosphatase RsbU/P
MYTDRLSYCSDTPVEQMNMDIMLKREINLARNIQSTLLNGKTPIFEGGEVSGFSLPARLIGGDYYDFYPLLNGKIRIVIGDVMGKGIPAAMLMILTRGAFRSAAESTRSPGDTLTAINQAIYQDLRTLRSFVTLFCADWDPSTATFTYANAGHHLPLHISGTAHKVKEVPKVKGIMIGGLPNQIYTEESVQLEEQDTIFFYTDGIVEAQNNIGEQYKIKPLIKTLLDNKDKDVSKIQTNVIQSVHEFTEGVPQKDDITMIVLKIHKLNQTSKV